METIQVEVSPELAQRLRTHSGKLTQILEWGLHYIEAEEKTEAKSVSLERRKTLDALRASGLMLELDPTLAARYQAGADKSRRTPIYVKGKPLSEIIVAERGPAWDEEG
jgi:hypothetical protein